MKSMVQLKVIHLLKIFFITIIPNNNNNNALILDLEGLQNNAMALKLWRTTGMVKLPAVQEYIFELLERDDTTKILIFAHHQNILDGLESSMWSKVYLNIYFNL